MPQFSYLAMPLESYIYQATKKDFMVDVNEMRLNILHIANAPFTHSWDTLKGYSENDINFELELINGFLEVCIILYFMFW